MKNSKSTQKVISDRTLRLPAQKPVTDFLSFACLKIVRRLFDVCHPEID
jgi:hypothetical protein